MKETRFLFSLPLLIFAALWACPSTARAHSVDTTVTAQMARDSVCDGSDITLNVALTGLAETHRFIVEWTADTVAGPVDAVDSTVMGTLMADTINVLAANGTGFYRAVVRSESGYTQASFWRNVVVFNALSAPSISSDADTLCDGMAARIVVNSQASGGSGAYVYQWQQLGSDGVWADAVMTLSKGAYLSANLTANTAFRVIVTDTVSGCDADTSNIVSVVVLNDFTPGVVGDTAICNGTAATLSFATLPSGYGGQYAYSWESSSDGVTFATIDGAVSDSYATPNLASSAWYRVTVTPQRYCTSRHIIVDSSIAVTVWDVMDAGTIGNPDTVCYGSAPQQPLTLLSGFTGGSGQYSYQWYKRPVGDVNSVAIAGANGTSFLPGVHYGDTLYVLQANDNVCNSSINSSAVRIHAWNALVAPVLTSLADTLCDNMPARISIQSLPSGGNGGAFAFQWQQSASGMAWTDVDMSQAGGVYTSGDLTADAMFRLVATDTVSQCGTVTSNELNVTVLNDFTPGVVGDTAICNGTAATLSFATLPSGYGGQYAYSWESSSDGVTFATIDGAVSDSYATPNLASSAWYRVTVTPQRYCTSRHIIVDSSIAVTVWDVLDAGTIGNPDTVCYGSAPQQPLTLLSGFTGGSGQYSYQWYKRPVGDVNSVAIAGANGTSFLPGVHYGDTLYMLQANDNVCNGSISSSAVRIHAWNALVAPGISYAAVEPICFGTQPSQISVTNSATGGDGQFSYQWQTSVDGTAWSDVDGETSSVAYSPDTLQSDRWFRLEATTGCGTVFSDSLMVSVYPDLVAGQLTGDTTLCFNQGTSISIGTTTGAGDNFIFLLERLGNTSNDTVGVSTTGFFTLDSLQTTATYRAVVHPVVGCADVVTNNVIVAVWAPFAPAVLSSDTGDVCSLSTAMVSPVAPATGGDIHYYGYYWQTSYDGVDYTSDTVIYGNTVQNYIYYADTDSCVVYFRLVCLNGCASDTSNAFVMRVNPLPEIPTLYGDTTIQCTNQRNLEYWVDNDQSMQYRWNIVDDDEGELLSSGDSSAVLVHWYDGVANASLGLTVTYKATGCRNEGVFSNIQIDTANHAPDKTHIVIKKGANILICADSTPGAHYEWGMVHKASGREEMIPESNCQYVKLPDSHPIDTANYDYFVDISYGNVPCVTRTYYTRDERGVDWWSDNNVTLKLQPNPSFGNVFYSLSDDVEGDYQVSVYDAVGHCVYSCKHSDYQKESLVKIDKSLGQGVYIVSVVTKNRVLTKKIIVK